jgi:HCOMODA/2-hydroxy-3-carboxy-muconic semialdehyde decarboxylase
MCAACDHPNVENEQKLHPPSAGPVDPALIQDLVSAYRILAHEGVLDSFGHVSMRHPNRPDRYLIARAIAPGSVTSADIMEFDLDSVPVDQRGRGIYMERFIHGEIYKLRSDVMAVVHSHRQP